MPDSPATFDTPHNEAFRALGALGPGQQWSAFDVHRDLAREGTFAQSPLATTSARSLLLCFGIFEMLSQYSALLILEAGCAAG